MQTGNSPAILIPENEDQIIKEYPEQADRDRWLEILLEDQEYDNALEKMR